MGKAIASTRLVTRLMYRMCKSHSISKPLITRYVQYLRPKQSQSLTKPSATAPAMIPDFFDVFLIMILNTHLDRATFPVLGSSGQPDVRAKEAPITNPTDEAIRELEAVGTVISNYLPTTTKFLLAKAPADGYYKIALNAYSIWVGPGTKKNRWWQPNLDVVSKGRRDEPITVYAERPPGQTRRLGAFDVGVEPTTRTIEVYLLKGETITVDAARLHRSRYPAGWRNPLATLDGQPGVAFRWLEVSGPHTDGHPSFGHRLLFGDLPYSPAQKTSRLPLPALIQSAMLNGCCVIS